jgi:hypothetical protein
VSQARSWTGPRSGGLHSPPPVSLYITEPDCREVHDVNNHVTNPDNTSCMTIGRLMPRYRGRELSQEKTGRVSV